MQRNSIQQIECITVSSTHSTTDYLSPELKDDSGTGFTGWAAKATRRAGADQLIDGQANS
ncbi:hypothetical protein J6590_006550 [Homalodisca vitripennis]|nr:hypothetical protein J6590_006550 [Homalodisca vitripennis]